jgi:hypothetical protein
MDSITMNSVTGIPYSSYDQMNNLGTNPVVLIILSIVIVLYYVLFASLGKSSSGTSNGETSGTSPKSGGIIFLEILLWSVFIALVLLNGMTYFFDINIVAGIKNIFSGVPEIDVTVTPPAGDAQSPDPVPEIKIEKQVFHIPDNKYTYENAKALCKAYGSRLANYSDIKKSHDKGADWCGFGWSEGQYAYYPTQLEKWKKLQNIKGHEHDCGRPGINGGYIANPNVRFGANCYGYKPKITQQEAQMMEQAPMYPRTKEEQNFDKRVDYWRNNIADILVAPFNHNNWSII